MFKISYHLNLLWQLYFGIPQPLDLRIGQHFSKNNKILKK